MELTTSWQKVAEGSHQVASSNVYAITALYLRYDDRDTTNNKDIIYWQITARANHDQYGYGYNEPYSIYEGSNLKASGEYREGSWPSDPVSSERVIASGSWEQEHDDDGTWESTITFNGSVYSFAYTQSFDVSLPIIPRQATLLTADDFTDIENPTITYKNPAGDVVDELAASIYDVTGTINYVPYRAIPKTGETSELSYTFNLTEQERNTLRQACSGDSLDVKFFISTKIGNNYYYSYLQRTMTIENGNYVKINGNWKEAIPSVNDNGTWKRAVPYVNDNGTWKKGIY